MKSEVLTSRLHNRRRVLVQVGERNLDSCSHKSLMTSQDSAASQDRIETLKNRLKLQVVFKSF